MSEMEKKSLEKIHKPNVLEDDTIKKLKIDNISYKIIPKSEACKKYSLLKLN